MMSVEHTPPSTYILRDLYDVAVPSAVSWWPQTLGWKIVVSIFALTVLYGFYRYVQYRWRNRYRQEGIEAVTRLDPNEPQFATQLFSIMKVVLAYLDRHNNQIFGEAFIDKVNALCSSAPYNRALAQRWMNHLVDPSVQLDEADKKALIQQTKQWLRQHQGKTR